MSELAKHQPLMLRRRPDLVESVIVCQGDYVSVIKDPVALQYFHLEGPDRSLLQLLDGRRSLSDVCETLQRQFPESQVEEQTVHGGIQRFHQQGLLISSGVGLGDSYLKRGRKQLMDKVSEFFSSILAMRFPGVNPTRFLDWCKPVVSLAFHPAVLAICIIYMLMAACTLLVRLEEFYLEMPRIGAFFSFENLPFFVATIFVTKTIHELGHAFVCHHLGAQPHAIGFMLLVLSPAAYCDASDSWMLKKKRDRILIALAGMYFELILAATAVFVWLMSDPGWLNLFCVNLIIVSSVSTVVFNANPLLRYDGYYVLSDYLEIPNMSKKANEWLLSVSRQLFLGMPPIRNLQLPDRNRMAFYIYAVAAFIYRWFVMAVIYWFLITLFESYHVAVIGYVLAAISIGKTLSGPLSKTWKFFTRHGATQEIQMPRVFYSLLVIAVLLYAILFVPLPRAEHAYMVLRPVDYRSAYAETEGVLKEVVVEPGDKVVEGDLLAKKFEIREYTDEQYAAELERIREQFEPLVALCKEKGRAMRIGTNHGSLSDRIMNRYGDTPLGMVESALEFARLARENDYHNFVFSMKASNPKVMIEAYRLLVARLYAEGADWNYHLHLGVTEAGDGEDGRIKSAIGIGSLLADGVGDTIRVSLTEDAVHEIPVAKALVAESRVEGGAARVTIGKAFRLRGILSAMSGVARGW